MSPLIIPMFGGFIFMFAFVWVNTAEFGDWASFGLLRSIAVLLHVFAWAYIIAASMLIGGRKLPLKKLIGLGG